MEKIIRNKEEKVRLLKENNYKAIRDYSEMPEGYQLVCILPDGRMIITEKNDEKSVHYEFSQIINPQEDNFKSFAELVVENGYMFTGDISDGDNLCISLNYLKGYTTLKQREKLRELREHKFEFVDGGMFKQEFMEACPWLTEQCFPENNDEKAENIIIEESLGLEL